MNNIIKKSKSKEKEPENAERALGYALFLLNIRQRSIAEIKEKMSDRGFIAEVIKQTLERLNELHYIDDERYAEIIVRDSKSYKSWGYQRVRLKLIERKLPKEVIDAVLERDFTEADELVV